jgi:hypothetical protein
MFKKGSIYLPGSIFIPNELGQKKTPYKKAILTADLVIFYS